ncbi:MAG: TlpA disulfide reductase family protein [Acetobacter aceti]|uniref:Alkyl hydroperoxide reductase n=1 Tax=Acetobacter aceti TaxID=435 RepID=A0A1U9KG55_ACEAC|nr:TlpA disulfide reductase family protein [Acetobacter aceti]AQS84785.1 alkyl hydroperoxide reductase [Acetobacter aceti]
MPQHHFRPRVSTAKLKLQRRSILMLAGTLIAGMTPRKPLHAEDITDAPLSLAKLTRTLPQPLTSQTITDGDGIEHSLGDFRGRPTIVHLWATWCGPCIQEIPALATLIPSLTAQGVTVLPVSVDHRGPEVVRPFLSKLHREDFPSFYDQRRVIPNSLEETTLPLTLFLNRQGEIICRHAGPLQWDAPDAAAVLLRLMS